VNGLERIKFEGVASSKLIGGMGDPSCECPGNGLLECGYNIHLVVVGEYGGEYEEEMDVCVCPYYCCCLRLGCGVKLVGEDDEDRMAGGGS
jgi:hypothetical protein